MATIKTTLPFPERQCRWRGPRRRRDAAADQRGARRGADQARRPDWRRADRQQENRKLEFPAEARRLGAERPSSPAAAKVSRSLPAIRAGGDPVRAAVAAPLRTEDRGGRRPPPAASSSTGSPGRHPLGVAPRVRAARRALRGGGGAPAAIGRVPYDPGGPRRWGRGPCAAAAAAAAARRVPARATPLSTPAARAGSVGLILGASPAAPARHRVAGVNVCDDRDYPNTDTSAPSSSRWGLSGRKAGETRHRRRLRRPRLRPHRPERSSPCATAAARLILDPVYTGKAFFGRELARPPPVRRAVVFLHTGGIFGLFPDRLEFKSAFGAGAAPLRAGADRRGASRRGRCRRAGPSDPPPGANASARSRGWRGATPFASHWGGGRAARAPSGQGPGIGRPRRRSQVSPRPAPFRSRRRVVAARGRRRRRGGRRRVAVGGADHVEDQRGRRRWSHRRRGEAAGEAVAAGVALRMARAACRWPTPRALAGSGRRSRRRSVGRSRWRRSGGRGLGAVDAALPLSARHACGSSQAAGEEPPPDRLRSRGAAGRRCRCRQIPAGGTSQPSRSVPAIGRPVPWMPAAWWRLGNGARTGGWPVVSAVASRPSPSREGARTRGRGSSRRSRRRRRAPRRRGGVRGRRPAAALRQRGASLEIAVAAMSDAQVAGAVVDERGRQRLRVLEDMHQLLVDAHHRVAQADLALELAELAVARVVGHHAEEHQPLPPVLLVGAGEGRDLLLQGWHQVAQKLTTTTFPAISSGVRTPGCCR